MQQPRPHVALDGLPDPQRDPQFYDGVPFKRFLAWLIDVGVVSIFTLLSVFFTFGVGVFVFPLLWLVINFAYRVLTIATGSATWGMRFAGIELRNIQGNRFDMSEAAIHTVLYYLLNMMVLGQILSAVMMLSTPKGQGLHDYLLGTTAINRPVD